MGNYQPKKMSNNSETDTRNMAMNLDYETGVDHSDAVKKNLCETPPSGEITMTSFSVGNKTSLSWKP